MFVGAAAVVRCLKCSRQNYALSSFSFNSQAGYSNAWPNRGKLNIDTVGEWLIRLDSSLSEFRERLISGHLEQQLLDTLLMHCQERGWVKARGTQRTDSTHVLGAISATNRLESIGETLRAALNALAATVPNWLCSLGFITPEWFDCYSRRVEEYRLSKGDTARQAYASTMGTAGAALLRPIYDVTAS